MMPRIVWEKYVITVQSKWTKQLSDFCLEDNKTGEIILQGSIEVGTEDRCRNEKINKILGNVFWLKK